MIAVAVATMIAMRDAMSAAAGHAASSSTAIAATAPATVSQVTAAVALVRTRPTVLLVPRTRAVVAVGATTAPLQ